MNSGTSGIQYVGTGSWSSATHVFPTLQISRLDKDADADLALPGYATDGAAGLDLAAAVPKGETLTIKRNERTLVPTGLVMAIPSGYEGQIRPRSGLAFKHAVTVLNAPGTIDSDYRGEVKVMLVNWGDADFDIRRGDRIAQLVIARICRAEINMIDIGEMTDTERGVGGFGSTGLASDGVDPRTGKNILLG